MNRTELSRLFTELLDDAAMYPPAHTKLPAAVRDHARHRLSWYADTVGPMVCNARRLPALAVQVAKLGIAPFAVTVVVPDGIGDLAHLQVVLAAHPQLLPHAVEVPLKRDRLGQAAKALEPLRALAAVCYVEIPADAVTDRCVHDLSALKLRLKLRTGGTSIEAFHNEKELAAPLLACAAERLQFKCTAGLHNAVRHRDTSTGFEHHGFLNVALAARAAAATGSAAVTAQLLADQDPTSIADQVLALSSNDIDAIRAMFCSFGTCSIDEPIADLVSMGLAKAP